MKHYYAKEFNISLLDGTREYKYWKFLNKAAREYHCADKPNLHPCRKRDIPKNAIVHEYIGSVQITDDYTRMVARV